MQRKLGILIGVVMLMAMIIPPAILTQAAAPTEDEWFANAAKPYAGTTIKGISERTTPSQFMQQVLSPAFTKATGIKMEFELSSWDDMYEKEIKDMQSGAGIYDFEYIEQDFVSGSTSQKWLVDQTQFATDHPDLVAPGLDVNDFTSYCNNFIGGQGAIGEAGHWYATPFEAFLKTYVYRKDLFTDPTIMAAFKAKTGWDLRPAVNWDEYKTIADFFTAYGKEKGQELYGSVVTAAAHPSNSYELVETIWPAWGIYNWGLNKDLKAAMANGGMVDSPQAKAALKYWIDMLKDAPPEARTSTWDEVAASFAGGRAAQGFIYGDNLAWVAQDATKSMVTGKVGVALPPLAPGVINDAVLGNGYIGYYDGGALGIPTSSKNKEAAYLWTQWVVRKSVQGDFANFAFRIIRNSTFSDPKVQELNPKVGQYFDLLKTGGPLFRGAPAYPFHRQVLEVYQKYFNAAFAGEMTADAACDALAKDVDAKLLELGYTKK
jgi:multiple sugar transport system substrate-binding protein